MSREWSRRAVLRAVGAAPALAPFVPLLSAEAAGAPKRVIFFHTPNGLLRQELVPDATTGAYKRILEPCVKHQQDILFLEGVHLNSYFVQNPRPPNDHPPPLGHLLTGAEVVDPKDGKAPSQSTSWFASDISIDQFLANRVKATTPLPFPSLVLGVKVGGYGWHLSHTGFRKPVFPDNDAAAVTRRLLESGAGGGQASAALTRVWAERRSARDVVREDLKSLLPRVPAEDRRKIEAHLTLIGEIEKREGMVTAGGSCKGFETRDHSTEPDEFIRLGRQQMDNLAMAIACDQTRVALLQWDICASGRRFTWLGVNEGHHSLSHEAARGAVYEGLTKIGRWYAEQFVYLIERLKAIPEGTGSVLDNTLIVWFSEHSSSGGDHGRKNIPFILAGKLGGTVKPGRVLRLDVSHNDLYVGIAQAMGFSDVTTFGKAEVCKGPLPGLAG